MSSKDIKKKKNTKPSKHSNVDSKKNIKNNKGFTLVEIIGVVIILGILVTVGAMSVRGYIESSKAKTYESYKKELSGATKNLFIDCMTNNEEDCVIPKKGNDVKLTYQELLDKGYSKRLKDPDGDGYCDKSYVIAKNSGEDVSNIEYQVCLFCNNYKSTENGCVENNSNDTTPPTCGEKSGEGSEDNWTGNNRVITVKCIDGESGCKKTEFSRSIGYDGQVTKKSTVKIEDNAGNKVNCKVNAYVDREKPTCTLEIEQSSSTGWYAGSVTVKLKSTSDGEGSGVAETGMGTSLMNRKYNSMDSYTVKSGIVTVFGYVKDKVGNEGYCSKEVKIDDTKPTGSVYMGYQVYPKENAVISGETITISNLEKYGNIDGVAITLKNNLGIVHSAISAKGDDKSLKVSGGIQVGKKFGVIKITKGTYDKLAITVPGSTSSNQIEKVELIKNENVTSVWTNKNVSVYFEAKDTITGVGSYSYDGGKTFGSENIKYFSQNTKNIIQVKDKAGNVSINYSYEINKIDKKAPKITLVTYKCSNGSCDASSNGTFQESLTTQGNVGSKTIDWNNTGGKFNYEISDVSFDYETWEWNQSGSTKYTDPTYGKETHNTLSGAHTLTAQGYRTGKITAYDKAGNSSSITVAVKIDKTNPDLVITNPYDGKWATKKYKLDFSKSTDSFSGIKNYAWSYNNADFTLFDGTDKDYFSQDQNRTVYIRSCDYANNCVVKTTRIRIDKTAPSLDFTNPKDGIWTNQNISFTVNSTDATSGVEGYYYSYNGKTYYKDQKDMVFSAERDDTAYIKVCDNAGNCTVKTTRIKIDKTAPTVVFTNPKEGTWTNENITFIVNSVDHGSGIEGYYYSYNNVDYYKDQKTMTFSAERNSTAYIRVCDNAGNCGTKTTRIKIDKTAPRVSVPSNILDNAVFQQKNKKGEIVSTAFITNKSCNTSGDSCSADLCLANITGSFTVNGEAILNAFADDGSAVNSGMYSYTQSSSSMLDKNGNVTASGGCLWTDKNNPCTWTLTYYGSDRAGNKSSAPFKLIYRIGYIKSDSFCQ